MLAVISQNPLSSLTAVYDTDAAVLDAAVSHVTRLTGILSQLPLNSRLNGRRQ